MIEEIFAPLAPAGAPAFGLSDDAAVYDPPAGRALVITKDVMAAGVHFPAGEDAGLVAQKLLRVNLSDLAAMGARPRAYTLSLALPEDRDEEWVGQFALALAAEQESFDLTLIGGDTVATPGRLTVTVTAFGTLPAGSELRRSNARAGDAVYVSGAIGDAALGLKVLKGELPDLAPEHARALKDRYHRPRPRVSLGPRLTDLANAAIDISDGLAADLGHVCAASGMAATIMAPRVPLSEAARAAVAADPGLMTAVLTGGDDYELLFTCAPDDAPAVAALSRELDLPLTAIGQVAEGDGSVRVIDANGRDMVLGDTGYRHF
ncbi:MAG: thiamine-phosphate kinase [Proteobacteria bacterium]|nr:thiamine-phosphate kinase [Pseudomonadota bacterium]